MSILSFIISPGNTLSWVFKDPSGNLINHGVATSLKDLLDIKADHIKGYIYHPLLTRRELQVPPAKTAEINSSIPFLMEDELLTNLEDLHIVTSKRRPNGNVSLSMIPHFIMKNIDGEIINSELKVSSLCDLSDAIPSNSSEAILVIFKEYAILKLGTDWSWCSDLQTILGLLKNSFDEFQLNTFKVFLNSDLKIDWPSYTQIDPQLYYVKDEQDYLLNQSNQGKDGLNLLVNEYEPRLSWKKWYKNWKFPFFSTLLIIFLYFSQLSYEVFLNNSHVAKLNLNAESLFFTSFPEENRSLDYKLLLRKKLRNIPDDKDIVFLSTLGKVSQIIINNKNVSLNAVSYDFNKNQFLLEVELSSFEDIEVLKSIMIRSRLVVEIGSSRRSGSSILSEIFIKN
jgi:type II secretory pathway component PulL